jgi:asparagine synthase (glutamine-hydrolysing)
MQLARASWFNDEPLAHGNDVHLLAIATYAKSRVTVLLSGEGADELIGGYVRYQPLRFPRLLSLMQPWLLGLGDAASLNGRWRKLSRFLKLGSLDRFVLFNACDVLPEDLRKLGLSQHPQFGYREGVLAEARKLYPDELVRQAMYVDQHTFLCSVLDRNDRMTMGASIECRVPFLDFRLVELTAALPTYLLFEGFKGKALLRSAVGSRLSRDVLAHRKWGFGVPWCRYLRQVESLRAILLELPKNSLLSDSPLDQSAVRQLVDDFCNGDDRAFPVLLQILMIVVAWSAIRSGSDLENGGLSYNKNVQGMQIERAYNGV